MNGGDFADLFRGEAVFPALAAADKPSALAALADRAAPLAGLPSSLILERIRERETLGSTGFGQGAAIPHARIAGLDRLTVVLARLAQPIDYGALDGEPVDLLVLLLSPEDAGADHLKALARISRTLRNRDVLQMLRAADDAGTMRAAVDRPALAASRAA
ncbi:PTS sugar transporter subunit IIA [Polymorphobacter sp.]|uniref:PTS sugar transporter subunit IIA n=1 Tax=Polymorphobacter sp. TaxID=1909290 RepID=UPI003F6FC8F9